MTRPRMLLRVWIALLALAVAAMPVSGAHLHLCLDGGEARATVHASEDGAHHTQTSDVGAHHAQVTESGDRRAQAGESRDPPRQAGESGDPLAPAGDARADHAHSGADRVHRDADLSLAAPAVAKKFDGGALDLPGLITATFVIFGLALPTSVLVPRERAAPTAIASVFRLLPPPRGPPL